MEKLQNRMMITGAGAQYDDHAKYLLSQKIVLAYILSEAVEEYMGMKPEEVIKYIEGDAEVSAVSVMPGEPEFAPLIRGTNVESAIPGEGVFHLDCYESTQRVARYAV